MLSGLNTGLPACGRIDRIAPPVSGPAALITASASPMTVFGWYIRKIGIYHPKSGYWLIFWWRN
jgi:hypothetical protein